MEKQMRKSFIVVFLLINVFGFSQDTIEDKKIKPTWVEPEVVFEQPKEITEEEIPLSDVESIQKDLQFLEELPKSLPVNIIDGDKDHFQILSINSSFDFCIESRLPSKTKI